jgi:hypothetical protein
LASQAIDIGCLYVLGPIASEVGIAEVICVDDEDIGASGLALLGMEKCSPRKEG